MLRHLGGAGDWQPGGSGDSGLPSASLVGGLEGEAALCGLQLGGCYAARVYAAPYADDVRWSVPGCSDAIEMAGEALGAFCLDDEGSCYHNRIRFNIHWNSCLACSTRSSRRERATAR